MCDLSEISSHSRANKRTSTDIVSTVIPSPSIHTTQSTMQDCVVAPTNVRNVELTDKKNKKSGYYSKKNLRTKNNKRIIIAHLNINFLENKFEALESLVEGKVDILLISETKIDASFPLNQFILKGYSTPFRADRNSQGGGGGGLIIYVREDIPCKELKMSNLPGEFEAMFIELIIGRIKWFLMGGYNPKKEKIYYFLSHASKVIDKFMGNYENMIILGDLNVETLEVIMKDFCEMYNFRNLINEPTCYKNAKNPSCIDVILTNCPSCFNDSMTVETGLSNHHKMTLTVLKTFLKKKSTYDSKLSFLQEL